MKRGGDWHSGASADDGNYDINDDDEKIRKWNLNDNWRKLWLPKPGLPQARVATDGHSDGSHAWSAAWGAMMGAGTVLLLVAILLIWKRPRRRDSRQLVPMDVGRNVSIFPHKGRFKPCNVSCAI